MAEDPGPEPPFSVYERLPPELHARIARDLPLFDHGSYASTCQTTNQVLKSVRTAKWAWRHNQILKETAELLES